MAVTSDHQGAGADVQPEDGLPVLYRSEGPLLRLVCPGGQVGGLLHVTCPHASTHTRKHTRMRTRKNTRMRTRKHTRKHTRMRTDARTDAHTQTLTSLSMFIDVDNVAIA